VSTLGHQIAGAIHQINVGLTDAAIAAHPALEAEIEALLDRHCTYP